MISQLDTLQQEFYMLKTAFRCQIALFALLVLPCGAPYADDIVIEMVSISADEAFEDTEPGILHFNGNFIMQSQEWHLESMRATVYGPPGKPDKVYLEGSPAYFLIYSQQNEVESAGKVEATAPEMEYQRSTNMLKLSGGAVLKLEAEVITSHVIEYNISTRRFLAAGAEGVLIEVPANASN